MPPPDAAQLKKTVEALRKRNSQLKATQAKCEQPDGAATKDSELIARWGGEVPKLSRQIDENGKALIILERKVEDARAMVDLERQASGLDAEAQYENFLQRLMDIEKREREKVTVCNDSNGQTVNGCNG